jgi:hypothetical protein
MCGGLTASWPRFREKAADGGEAAEVSIFFLTGQTLIWHIDAISCICYLFSMDRKPCIEYVGAFYHDITRGNQHQKKFKDPAYYQQLFHVLANTLIIALSILFILVHPSYAQTDKDLQYVKRYLGGYEFQVTYREGGSLYGTYFFVDVHFCSSGKYLSSVQTRKQTVMGNEQVNNWTDSGNWGVVPYQGYATLRYLSASGAQDIVPIQILPDGTIRPLSGAFMQRQGKAQCR